MQIYDKIEQLPDDAKGAVIAIGNFDGVHRGHQALLARAAEIAKDQDKKLGVLTFEPHPRRLFQPDQPPARLTPTEVKAWRLKQQGVDFLFPLEFNWDFASQSAEDFIQHILVDGLNAAHIIVGDDFCFGQLRKGSAETIKQAGLPIEVIDKINDEKNEVISSSRIRQLIRKGDIDTANQLLGWEWEIRGKIFRGDRRGHELGYPTANILLHDTIHPAYGIYACRVQIESDSINVGDWLPAATNIGIRPMFEVAEGQVEAHILDFPDRDIYNKILRVKPIKRLRGEAKFNSLDDLIVQMDKDCQKARKILA
jgi:riboflavin kinase/FMN adenylyltransferase